MSSLVTIGSLVLCMIIKPNPNATEKTDEALSIQKKPGIVKQIFFKKVMKDTPDRYAIHQDKEMFVIETLDGEAEITIGADACKRVVEPKEYQAFLKEKEKREKGLKTAEENKNLESDKALMADDKAEQPKEEIKLEKETQNKEEKNKLLKELDQ